jgi:hypothetical protein
VNTVIQPLKDFSGNSRRAQGRHGGPCYGASLYLGLRYFLFRRRLAISMAGTLNFISVSFYLQGLPFFWRHVIFASSQYGHNSLSLSDVHRCGVWRGALIDVFLLSALFSRCKKIVRVAPLRTVIKLSVFCVAILPIFSLFFTSIPLL